MKYLLVLIVIGLAGCQSTPAPSVLPAPTKPVVTLPPAPTVPVVVYSAGETLNIDATFVVWILASMGHPHVYLLDGGSSKWSLEGREVARRYPDVEPAGRWWNSRTFRPSVATIADVQRGFDTGVLLVDARPHDQYVGDAGSQMRLGHLPGAVDRRWESR